MTITGQLDLASVRSSLSENSAPQVSVLQTGNSLLHRFSITPATWGIRMWDRIVLHALALYYFIEVPVNIAFKASARVGPVYLLVQLGLDVMLLLDMLVNCQRGYFNENSVLVLEPRFIRLNYFARWFVLDFVTMLPL